MDRAYSLLNVKALRETPDEWVIEGVASTPKTDRQEDIVEPMGAQFATPMALLWQHDSHAPVGRVEFARPSAKGIPYVAHLPKVVEPGRLKDRVDEAVQSIKYRVVWAVSIGFRALKNGVETMKDGGLRFKSWEWLELSIVTIPANSEATITSIKSLDTAALAASGRSGSSPGASGKSAERQSTNRSPKGNVMKTLQVLRDERSTKAARLQELVDLLKDADHENTEEENAEFDTLNAEKKALDTEIRVAEFEAGNAASARAVEGKSADAASRSRSSNSVTSKSNLPKGLAFTRVAIAMVNCRNSYSDAIKYAERWQGSTPEVGRFLKAAAGGMGNWGAELSEPGNLVGEFLELLAAETFLGRIQGFNRVPFNTKILVQTDGSLVNWVGEAAAKPVGELAFDTVQLGINKVAGIVVLTDELVKTATVNAEQKVQADLIKQIAAFLDRQFVDPSVAATSDNPASITNGVSPTPASGTTAEDFRADLRSLRASLRLAGINMNGTVLLMDGTSADVLSDMVNTLGQPEFPNLTSNGGTLRGTQVLVSDNVVADTTDGSMIVLLKASEILVADDGGVALDASREATLDMAGTNTPAFSLWQKNCVGLRAERFITWKKARAGAVAYITAANYGA